MADNKGCSPGVAPIASLATTVTIKGRESMIFKEMRKEMDALNELCKKVKVEGVKESVNKANALFNQLLSNRGSGSRFDRHKRLRK